MIKNPEMKKKIMKLKKRKEKPFARLAAINGYIDNPNTNIGLERSTEKENKKSNWILNLGGLIERIVFY